MAPDDQAHHPDRSVRLEVERALRESEARFRAMVEAVPSLTFEGDAEGRNTFSSERWCTYTGMTMEETLGDGWAAAIHPEDRAIAAGRYQEAARTGALYESRHRLRGADGTYRWFIARALPTRAEDGRIVRWTGSLTDVHDLVVAQEALRDSEERFRQLADAMPQLVWTARPDGVVDYYNRRHLEFSGIHATPEGEWRWGPVVHPDDRDATVAAWRRAISTGTVYEIEHRVQRADGTFRWYLSRAFPALDAGGRVTKWFGTATDVDAVKSAEAAIREADRRKGEFLATLSHELRNPLAPIRYALELLAREPAERSDGRAVHVIERQLNHMVRLVDDLLDVTRIASNKVRLRKREAAVAPLLQQALEAVDRQVRTAGHSVSLTLPPHPISVEADPDRVVQILINLLDNAVQYTPPGGRIAVSAEVTPARELRLTVADSGVGLGPEDADRVFEMFTQVSSTGRGGLGIGLALVKSLVELHGGRVNVESAGPGKGSQFSVYLPGARQVVAMPANPAGPAVSPPQARRILVVDDNHDAAEMMKAVLELEGHDVRLAYEATEALRVAAAFSPEVGLLDIGLPGLDGYELARRLRRAGDLGGMFLVAVTGWGQEEDRRRATEAGFDAHLTKPADPDAVLQLVATGASGKARSGG